MRSRISVVSLMFVTLALVLLSSCGGGGGSSTPPPPPPPPATLSIVTTEIPNGVVGKAYSATLQATGGSGTKTWTLTSGPSWLKLNSATGELTGNPTEYWYGWIGVDVRDTAGHSASAQPTLAIYTVLEIVPPPGGTLGLDYSGTMTARGGAFPIKKLTVTGLLPPGLTAQFDGYGNGTITGTPSQAGSFTFTAETSDSANPPQTVKSDITMVIDTHVAITTKEFKYGVEGRSYSDRPTAINGTTPYTWSAGWLPQGLSINSATGEITGTPTAGFGNVSLSVSDSSNPPQIATRSVRLDVYGKLRFGNSNPVFTVPAGWSSNSFDTGGGVPPLTYTVTSGQLPPGVSLNSNYGSISGTAQQGDYEFSVTVQDSASPPQVAERPFAMHVLPPKISADWTATIKGTAGKPLSYQFNAWAGTPPYSWSVTGFLPAGLTLSESGLLSGTPAEDGYFDFTAEVSDSASPVQRARTDASLQVLPLAPVPNNSIANATPLGWDGLSASISPYTDDNGVAAPDTDYFKFLAQGGKTLTIAANVGSPSYIDPVLELLDSNGARLKTCNNMGDDNVPSWIVADPTPTGYDDECINDDGYNGVSSYLEFKAPGNTDTIQTIYAHVVDYRGDARPDLTYGISVWYPFEPLRVRETAMPVGAVGRNISWTPWPTGGLGTTSLSLAAGASLPAGLSIAGNFVTGAPTTAGQYVVKLQERDSANPPEVVERTYQFTVVPQLTMNDSILPDATVGVPYDVRVPFAGGGQILKFSLGSASWPCCLYMREDGHIVGTPKEAGTFSNWVNVEDESGQGVYRYITLKVSDGALQSGHSLQTATTVPSADGKRTGTERTDSVLAK